MEDYLDELNPYTGELPDDDEGGESFLLNSALELETTPELLEAPTELLATAPASGSLSAEALSDDLEIDGDVGSLPL